MAVRNRLHNLKKRLNLPLVGKNQTTKVVPDAANDGVAVPKTPKKAAPNRVAKPRTPASGKKAPTKRTPKKQAKSDIVIKEDSDAEGMDLGEEPDYDLQPAKVMDEEAAGLSGSAATIV